MRNNTPQNRLIGNRLRKIRECAEITRSDVADYIGVSEQQIYKYETGKSEIKFQTMVEIANYLNKPILEFIVDDDGNVIDSDILRAIYQFQAFNSLDLKEKMISLMESINEVSSKEKIRSAS